MIPLGRVIALHTPQVYLVPGSQFFSRPAGWFRIIFSVQPQILEEGLARIEVLLAKRGQM